MRLQLAVGHDVLDGPSANREIVRDNSPMASPPQSPMASPPEPFRTHVRSPAARSGRDQFAQPRGEIGALGVVSVRSKRGKLPRCVRRIFALRMPPPAQLPHPSVLDSGPLERARNFRLIELRPSLGTRERAHVSDDRYPMLTEQLEKLLNRMRRMPDRENCRRRRWLSHRVVVARASAKPSKAWTTGCRGHPCYSPDCPPAWADGFSTFADLIFASF